jgi:hypothetical protein
MTLQQIIGCRKSSGDVGIEIELEADNIPDSCEVEPVWRREVDQSLRGESGEFVLNKPIKIEHIDGAFDVLKKAFKKSGLVIRPTYRAGIHVHVNVQHLTPLQLINFICAYFLLEEVFLGYCDKSRRGNHFCLRMSDASYSLDSLVNMIVKEDLRSLNTEDLRYASLNVTSLFKYGSIEFRALESTLDYDKIKVWASVLIHLRDYAASLSDPTQLLGDISSKGFEQFLPVMLGQWYPHFRPYATADNVRKGVRNIQFAVYARDWTASDLNIFKSKSLF